jgi:hypothetical protein
VHRVHNSIRERVAARNCTPIFLLMYYRSSSSYFRGAVSSCIVRSTATRSSCTARSENDGLFGDSVQSAIIPCRSKGLVTRPLSCPMLGCCPSNSSSHNLASLTKVRYKVPSELSSTVLKQFLTSDCRHHVNVRLTKNQGKIWLSALVRALSCFR